MIKHVVMIKLIDKADKDFIIEQFNNFGNYFDEVKSMEVKQNCYDRDINMDLMFISEFENEVDLKNYIDAPYHIEMVTNNIKPKVQSLIPFDYK